MVAKKEGSQTHFHFHGPTTTHREVRTEIAYSGESLRTFCLRAIQNEIERVRKSRLQDTTNAAHYSPGSRA